MKEAFHIKNAIKGKNKSQKWIFDRYYSYVYSVVFKYLQCQELSKDATSLTFIKLFKSLGTYDKGKSAFETWLCKIAINEALQLIRSRKKIVVMYDIEQVNQIAEVGGDNIALSDVYYCIEKLDSPGKEILKLFFIEGFSHKEISRMLGITEGYSRVCLSQAKKNLRQHFKKLEVSNEGSRYKRYSQ